MIKPEQKIALVNKTEIINVVYRTLSYIDKRIIEHGERVAFIAMEMLRLDDNILNFDRDKLFILCSLHDIGAYKTEEIDDMVQFETHNATAHAIYGYLFLKNASNLNKYAEAILYHHTPYLELQKKSCLYKEYAELIFLADRIDILLQIKDPKDFETLLNDSKTLFNPILVEKYLRAEKAFHITQRLKTGEFRNNIASYIHELHVTSDEVLDYLKMLVYSIDFRSVFTVTHTINTQTISLELGKYQHLSEIDLQNLSYGAFLHDIGKIAIPVQILEKPGKLTPTETVLMHTHITKTEEIIKGIVSDTICHIAVRHHEKMNGTGYPYALTAKELTLPERILAVADIMSALTGKRSYKEPFPKHQVLTILSKMSQNGELCPSVCEIASIHFDEIIQATEQSNHPVIQLYENIKDEYQELFEKMKK